MSAHHTRPALSRTVRMVDGTTTVTLDGELDLVTAIPLMAHLDVLVSGPHPDLVLDLRPVSFIDCAGLAVLCRARKRVRARHGRLRLVTADTRFLRILRATGLGGVFEIHPDLSATEAGTPVAGTSPSAAMG
ncbi:anti-sigma factor antagonist [Streptomyces canus]|uniref:STAS domain-containing protein n=1 Tax=Streptomyces canus TaxID=58343 RepID=UPI0036EED0C7